MARSQYEGSSFFLFLLETAFPLRLFLVSALLMICLLWGAHAFHRSKAPGFSVPGSLLYNHSLALCVYIVSFCIRVSVLHSGSS